MDQNQPDLSVPVPKLEEQNDFDSEADEAAIGDSPNGGEGDHNALRPCTRSLGLSIHYVETWGTRDAFRELYQNGKDAILVSFDLRPEQFKVELQELNHEIRILAKRRDTLANPEMLGYIRFKELSGMVELTNFQAHLTPQDLEQGGTTKRGHATLVGTHGEGLKLATLVLTRSGRHVRIVSSSYHWNFRFRGTTLYCRLSAANPQSIARCRERHKSRNACGQPREFVGNAWEDVSVTISRARGDSGRGIAEDEFRAWMEVALDLVSPRSSDIISTKNGDILLDPSFAGKVYLKGLLLPKSNSRVKSLRFGYNILHGETDRDRQRLTSSSKEAYWCVNIWQSAISQRGGVILDKFIDLLQKNDDYADADRAEKNVSSRIAEAIWGRLLESAPVAFYYNENTAEKACEIIRRDLGRQPAQLSKVLWNILRRFSLVQTPHEYRIHLFANSEPSVIAPDAFSSGIRRYFFASLKLHTETENVAVIYVRSADSEIDVLFRARQNILKVNEKWLDFQKIHGPAPCQVSGPGCSAFARPDVFLCDHIVENLYELALNEILMNAGKAEVGFSSLVRSLRHDVRTKLRQMPRILSFGPTNQDGELEVNWADGESCAIRDLYPHNASYLVVLHTASLCFNKKDDLFLEYGISENDTAYSESDQCRLPTAPCGCAQQIVSGASSAIFRDLCVEERYFPMVANVQELPAPRPALFHNGRDAHAQGSDENQQDEHALDSQRSQQSVDADSVRSQKVERSSESEGPNATSTNMQIQNLNRPARDKEDKLWEDWRKKRLRATFNKFVPKRITQQTRRASSIPSLECEDLDYTFMKDEYSQIRVRQSDQVLIYIVFIHDIVDACAETGPGAFYLTASKYSLLESTFPFARCDESAGKELILHFSSFDAMGTKEDAESILLDDITQAESLDFDSPSLFNPVEHLAQAPDDSTSYRFYCRFAIRGATDCDTAHITPIGSHLLKRFQDRRKIPKYGPLSRPIVLDLSPGVLGLAEGFSQENCEIFAGLNFDPASDMTWKARYNSAEAYDGNPATTLQHLLPRFPRLDVPLVALVSGANHRFTLSDARAARTVATFSRPLDIVKASLESSTIGSKPIDFLVLTMSAAVLHESVIQKYSETIFSLLEKRYSVCLKLVYLPQYGLPQDRNVVLLLASRVYSLSNWEPDLSDLGRTIGDKIGDLSFETDINAFAWQPAPAATEVQAESRIATSIYNHETGGERQGAEQMNFHTFATPLDHGGNVFLSHPTRRDRLTVRELARIQGFPDDFIFYHPKTHQYKKVIEAFPPPIARMVAKSIVSTVKLYTGRQLVRKRSESQELRRWCKRIRVVESEGRIE